MIGTAQETGRHRFQARLHIFLGHFKQLAHKIAEVFGGFFHRKVGFAEAEMAEVVAADPVRAIAVKNGRVRIY